MVPYLENITATTARVGGNTSSTGTVRRNYAILTLTATSLMSDAVLLAMKKAKEIVRLSVRPHFDRIMRMRNTDGRPVKYSTWKPVRMYNARDNIGTRNFKKT